MKIVNLIVSVILIICIPVASICVAYNLSARLPDLYQYQFKSSEVIGALSLEMDENQLGEFFSQYMTGESDKFQIEYQFGENTDKLFTGDEQETMLKLREKADIVFLAGGIALALALLSYFLIYKQNLKMLLRRSFNKALVLYVLLAATILILTFVEPVVKMEYARLFPYAMKDFLVLPQLLPLKFFVYSAWATVALSLIIMLFSWYFTWKITKPRRIFGSSR